jgi:hypothetical protein
MRGWLAWFMLYVAISCVYGMWVALLCVVSGWSIGDGSGVVALVAVVAHQANRCNEGKQP